MNEGLKQLLRTVQTNFPYLLDAKITLMRMCRNVFRVPAERDFSAIRLFPFPDDALFLDVGANRGQSTDAIRMHRKNCRIWLFEPNTLLHDKLERQFRQDARVTVNKFGLGDGRGGRVLYVPLYKKWIFDGLSSFDEENARGWLKNNIYRYRDRYLSIRELPCRIEVLDDLHLDPAFIKLDIQGWELSALRGGEQTIRTYEPVLLIESPGEAVLKYLAGMGYEYFAFRNGVFVANAQGDVNTFFMTKRTSFRVKQYIREY